ncbi:MAG: TonB-dependent receptor [Myxococcota bacterium]|nr:TonB-dependent receptor [Myxococcota bacterium]
MKLRSLLFALVALAAPVYAQSPTTGAIAGRVVERQSKEAMAGVTIVVTSKSLLEPQTAITDEDGKYKITELPPGDYTVTFYAEETSLVRTGIGVSANETASVYQAIRRGEVVEMHEPPPPIDVTSTDHGGRIDRKMIEKIPQPSRTADGVAANQPGAHNDGIGAAYSGSTSLENRYLVDGIDITGLTYGDVGTPVLNDFVEEIQVLTGGYNAEWGRAIGGIVNIVTKTGGNKFRGSVFGTFSPGYFTARRKQTPVNASSIDVVAKNIYDIDFGVEVGGPIIEDRLWFYAGIAPQLGRTDVKRTTKRQSDCRQLLPNGQMSGCDSRPTTEGGFGDGVPDTDPKTGFFITDNVDSEVRSGTSRALSSIGKLNLAISPKQQAQLSAIYVPSKSTSPATNGLPWTGRRAESMQLDTAARWSAKLDDDKLELDALVAWHHSTVRTGASDPAMDSEPAQTLVGGDLGKWANLGGESARTVEMCTDNVGSDPYPSITNCPMTSRAYSIGGPGSIANDSEDRIATRISVLRRAKAFGSHEIKAGIDAENDRKETARLFSGGAAIVNYGTVVDVTRWVQLAPVDTTDGRFDQTCLTPDSDGTTQFKCDFIEGRVGARGTSIVGRTLHWATYLRDSWQPRSNLTLNAGVRYEEQKMFYAESLRGTTDPLTGNRIGDTAMNLRGNFAPRLGAIWDPTEVGRSKLFASWGRFFEAIPMDINDRSFGGEVSYQQTFATSRTAPNACGTPDMSLGITDGVGCLTPSMGAVQEQLVGSSGVLVAPGIKAQYLDELLLGGEYQLLRDLKLGVYFHHRTLGRVIEDVSTDGASTYIIANPGEWSESEEDKLEDQIARTTDETVRARLENQLEMFRGIRRFERPERTYNAIEITLAHRFSRGLFVQGSYTWSHTEGNFPGSVSYDNGQIDPNISSQFDLIELLANRRGPLPQDRPHSIKVDGYYSFDIGPTHSLTFGSRLRLVSGTPKNALGGHYLYGPDESFLLPRGILGRTPMQHSADVHLAYARKLPRDMTAEVFIDIFNIYNHQGTFGVDTTYAPQQTGDGERNVNPISGGSYQDLIWAKSIDGTGVETATPVHRNPNFGKTVSRYAPASAQVGFRLTF